MMKERRYCYDIKAIRLQSNRHHYMTVCHKPPLPYVWRITRTTVTV